MEKKKVRRRKRKSGRPRLKEEEKLKHKVDFKVNDHELDILHGYFKKSNSSQSNVIRQILFSGKLTVIEKNEDTENIVLNQCELLDQLKRIGVNLNQAVKKLNASKEAKEVEKILPTLDSALKEFDKVYKANYELIQKIYGKW